MSFATRRHLAVKPEAFHVSTRREPSRFRFDSPPGTSRPREQFGPAPGAAKDQIHVLQQWRCTGSPGWDSPTFLWPGVTSLKIPLFSAVAWSSAPVRRPMILRTAGRPEVKARNAVCSISAPACRQEHSYLSPAGGGMVTAAFGVRGVVMLEKQ